MEDYQKEIIHIQKVLRANPRGMSVIEISKEINLNRNSVAKYLDILLVSGHVEMKSIGPAKVFFLSHKVPLSAMLNLSSDYTLVLDSGLKIVQANDNLLDLIDVKREVLIGQKIDDQPHPIFTNPKMTSKVKKAFEGKDSTIEISFHKAKKELYFRTKLIPTIFDDGEHGATIILEDITERKRAEQALQESRDKFRSILNSSPNAITVADLNGNIVECNQATLDMHGYSSKDELIGKSAFELIAKKDHKRAIENLKKTLEQGSVKNIEYTFLTKDGCEFSAELSASLIRDFSGKPVLLVAITKDISERKRMEKRVKESEEKYRKIFELSPEAIVLLDRKGNLLDVNGRLYDWLGYKAEDVIEKNLLEFPFLPKESKARAKKKFSQRMLGKNVPPYELDFITKSGEKRIGRIVATPIRDENKKIIMDLVMISDVSESKRAEKKL